MQTFMNAHLGWNPGCLTAGSNAFVLTILNFIQNNQTTLTAAQQQFLDDLIVRYKTGDCTINDWSEVSEENIIKIMKENGL